ncbi:naphthalene 1,2-dioxygenase [Paracidovorax avenae]|uniref:2Fe-2S iron-sulfur cluster-binding protein n=1 Tax=Paracidovorax avenae TaxID=80867 RepID=UPI000D21BBB6|nr:2Fe-2S iron-sulfur cluster-binding protein [Paracidovorax avenae]AVS97542.1 naphthalene 1,2-dioxygenase [Paracidovorax avenae]
MELHIEPLGRVLPVAPGANLLEVLRAHQIPVSYSCMAGRCGTCRCKVVAGEVLDSGQALRMPPLGGHGEAQYVMACQTVLSESCTIEIPEPDEVVVHTARTLKATVTAVETLTHDIRRVLLKSAKPLDFSPGQYAQLQFGPGLVRPYSMAGLPHDGELEFHVRLVEGGLVSTHVANVLAVGDAVRVSGPLGSAYLRRKYEGPMLCVAGGTGLAPILSIVRGALEAGMPNPIHVYAGARSARDVYGLQWLADLQQRHPQLKVHAVVAAADAAPGQRTGLVTDAIAQDWPSLEGWRAYLCGSPPMVEAVSLLARQRGIAPEHLYADAFYASTP